MLARDLHETSTQGYVMADVIYAPKQPFKLNGGDVRGKLGLARVFIERFALEEAECHLNAPGIGEHMLTGTAVREQRVEMNETQSAPVRFPGLRRKTSEV